MTLDQARIAEGIKIGLEKGRIEGEEKGRIEGEKKGLEKGITQTEEKNRKEIIYALHLQQKNVKEINDFFKLMNKPTLTDEEIKQFKL